MRKPIDEKKSKKLHDRMMEISSNIREEFDCLEAVEDHIKDIFSCDLDCVTCTEDERALCMQTFKKANFFWIRKIIQDEEMLEGIVEKMDEYRELLATATRVLRDEFNASCDDEDESDGDLVRTKNIDFDERRKNVESGLKRLYS